jgi:hypothetical protein
MKCPKCDGELKVDRSSEERDYIEVIVACKKEPEHRFYTFIHAHDLVEED